MFDIDAFITTWCGGIPGNYLKQLGAASNEELLAFRKKVKAHKKQPQKIQFPPLITTEHRTEKFCIHDDILLRAIRWERIVRNRQMRTCTCGIGRKMGNL